MARGFQKAFLAINADSDDGSFKIEGFYFVRDELAKRLLIPFRCLRPSTDQRKRGQQNNSCDDFIEFLHGVVKQSGRGGF
jgi:hypothetical protein